MKMMINGKTSASREHGGIQAEPLSPSVFVDANPANLPAGPAKQRPKSAEMTPGPGFRVRREFSRPSPELIEKFRAFDVPDVSDLLNRIYTMTGEIKNLVNDQPLVGPALTVKVFPGDNLMIHKALDLIQPGDVVVVDTSGSATNAVFGDMIANKAKHRGAAGFIIDGLIRDLDDVKDVGMPVFARGVTAFGPLHRGPGEVNYPISCDGIVVNPGDIIVADATGIVVVRQEFAEQLVIRVTRRQAQMASYIQNVRRGEVSNDWVDAQLAADNCMIE